MKFIRNHPYLGSVLFSLGAGFLLSLIFYLPYAGSAGITDLIFLLFLCFCCGIFLVYPFVLTAINLLGLILGCRDEWQRRTKKAFEAITILLGFLYSGLVLPFYEIQFQADWDQTLANAQVHSPVLTASWPTVITLACIGILGYLVLSLVPLNKMPPLAIVSSISAMYAGAAVCLLWILQVMKESYFLLCLFPINCLIIAASTIRDKAAEWNRRKEENTRIASVPLLNRLDRLLSRSALWPVAAFVLMWPLLGLAIGILVLFGQEPDAVIRAWTQTSDWNLSQLQAPQNVYYDEHYLCTVAAGGHRKLVKPLRAGIRHGHPVIVNRQLCVANAFEQILEEHIPLFHRHLRHFYDTYGFPLARMIRSPYTADLIYLIMKPLELLFLLVLYSCDINPENRIAVQYTGSGYPRPESGKRA